MTRRDIDYSKVNPHRWPDGADFGMTEPVEFPDITWEWDQEPPRGREVEW